MPIGDGNNKQQLHSKSLIALEVLWKPIPPHNGWVGEINYWVDFE